MSIILVLHAQTPTAGRHENSFRVYAASIWRGNYGYIRKDGGTVSVKDASYLLLQPVLDTASRDQATGEWIEASNFGPCTMTCSGHYRVGTKLNLYSHGALIGHATIKSRPAGDVECETGMPFDTDVAAPWPEHVFATVHTVAAHPNWQSEVDAATLRRSLELAKSILHTDSAGEIQSTQALDTKAAAAGERLLVGSYERKTKEKIERLFLIARHEGDQLIPLGSSSHEQTDLTSATDQEIETFFDQVDVDGDGVDELVTTVTRYEDYSFVVYKWQSGKWIKVFEGGGMQIC